MRFVNNLVDSFMLDAFKTMRQIAKSGADKETKEKALTEVFGKAIRMLDILEQKEGDNGGE